MINTFLVLLTTFVGRIVNPHWAQDMDSKHEEREKENVVAMQSGDNKNNRAWSFPWGY